MVGDLERGGGGIGLGVITLEDRICMIESRAPDIMQLCSISHDPIIWDRNADPIEKEDTYSLTTSLHHELLLLLSSPTTVKLKPTI